MTNGNAASQSVIFTFHPEIYTWGPIDLRPIHAQLDSLRDECAALRQQLQQRGEAVMTDDLTPYTADAMREIVERVARLQVVTDVSNGASRAVVSLQSPDPSVDVAEIQRSAASLLENERTHHRAQDATPPDRSDVFAVPGTGVMPDGVEFPIVVRFAMRPMARAILRHLPDLLRIEGGASL